ncbi:MAG: DUF5615 family PIN-like protein [Cryomorphaceae bacterium]|jgi:predicted nuclease of predicted toxin-antitoxin system|nr:DUF5615 family PIN-like protein [Cryomorphaceae bacterium]
MIILDAQLSQHLAKWLSEELSLDVYSVYFLGLSKESDRTIFEFAKERNAVVMTKDDDFMKLLHQFGPPPKIIWINCGNSTNDHLKRILLNNLHEVLRLLEENPMVEIRD